VTSPKISLDNCRSPEGDEMRFLKPVTGITAPELTSLGIVEKYGITLLQTELQDIQIHSSEHVETIETDHARNCKLREFYEGDEAGISYSVNTGFS
jgi:hypothetical protein